MAKFTGTIRRNDLEGGFYELVTDKGEHYRLSRCDAKPGARVHVEGSVEGGGFGIHMSGPSIKVSSITPA
ncbi:MAG: hypothetical protein H6713_09100 [Myxococcales bacterium]|nr:hypothetical protein [Myxococcales bacterium]MCB9750145.1 hypothetical protein [Myxococcales bacterium]